MVTEFQHGYEIDKNIRIWTLKKIKTINSMIKNIVKEIAKIEAIKFIRITEDAIQSSNELEGNKIKIPVTKPFHPTAIGVHLIFDFKLKTMEFYEMNSAQKGWGEKMVKASLSALPKDWKVMLVYDWSEGFWDKMMQKYNKLKWLRI